MSYDWRHKDENFQKRSYLMTSLVRNNITLSSYAYQFCDELIKQGWTPSFDDRESDRQINLLYKEFILKVKNDNN